MLTLIARAWRNVQRRRVPHFQALETSSSSVRCSDTSCGHVSGPLIGWWSQYKRSDWLIADTSFSKSLGQVGSSLEPQCDDQVDKSGAWQNKGRASVARKWKLVYDMNCEKWLHKIAHFLTATIICDWWASDIKRLNFSGFTPWNIDTNEMDSSPKLWMNQNRWIFSCIYYWKPFWKFWTCWGGMREWEDAGLHLLLRWFGLPSCWGAADIDP